MLRSSGTMSWPRAGAGAFTPFRAAAILYMTTVAIFMARMQKAVKSALTPESRCKLPALVCNKGCITCSKMSARSERADACAKTAKCISLASTTPQSVCMLCVLLQSASNVRLIVMHGRDAPAIFAHLAERKGSHSPGMRPRCATYMFFVRWPQML